ncbi:heavy-metal-associated domain-containing protein [Pelagovum sp. HNIBRBA483]|uniref:heavy-metal-associated domain-containing protein n=1 Tax=Pelagovum sp. HNIBRBA483 TaxID=3233341 RepID=UPI0034A33E6E
MNFYVPDMSCGHCKAAIEKTLMALDPMAGIAFEMDARKIDVAIALDTDAVLGALKDAGYTAEAV